MDDNFSRERHTINQHLLPEQIVAYHERRLSPDEAERIRAHLADCPDCTTELLALADLFDGEDDSAAEISPGEMDAAWQRQRERLLPAAPVVPLESRKEVRPPRREWRIAAPFALAASLLAVVALVQWRTIVRLETPRANPPLVNLEPVGSVRQSQGTPELRLSDDAEWGWVILYPSSLEDGASYDVEVVAPDGEILLRFKDEKASEDDNFRLPIPLSGLTAGNHRILLFERRDGQRRRVLDEFELDVSFSPSSPSK